MVGLVDLDEIAQGEGDLGYWLDRRAWSVGYALEAAMEVVRFAFENAHLVRLRSGHAADNHASRRILEKLGFRWLETITAYSYSRREEISQARCVLDLPAEH